MKDQVTYIFTILLPALFAMLVIWATPMQFNSPPSETSRFANYVPPPLSEEQLAGRKLFEENCATCHRVIGDMTGPQMYEAEFRVPGGRATIYEWVRKPGAFVKSDPYFKDLYEKYNKTSMTAYPNFSDEKIDLILDYVAIRGEQMFAGPSAAYARR